MQTTPEEIWQERLRVGLDVSTHSTRMTFVNVTDEVTFQIIPLASDENPSWNTTRTEQKTELEK